MKILSILKKSNLHSGETGPLNWEGQCAIGQSQSPVNLANSVFEKDLKANPFVFTG